MLPRQVNRSDVDKREEEASWHLAQTIVVQPQCVQSCGAKKRTPMNRFNAIRAQIEMNESSEIGECVGLDASEIVSG